MYETPWNIHARQNRQQLLYGLQISFPLRIFSKLYRILRMHGWTTDLNKRHHQVNVSGPLCYIHLVYPCLTESTGTCSRSLLHDRATRPTCRCLLRGELSMCMLTLRRLLSLCPRRHLLRPGWYDIPSLANVLTFVRNSSLQTRMEDKAKVHTSSLILGKYLLTAKPREISETAALDLCLVLYRLWRLWLMLLSSVHCIGAFVRIREHSLPFHVRHRVFAHDEKVLNIDICVCIYSCDYVAQGRLIRERGLLKSLTKSSVSLAIDWPSHLCPWPSVVQMHPCVDRWSCTQFHRILA